jgi:hypothetical protein
MGTTTSIQCPKCGHQFHASEALEHCIQEGRAEREGAPASERLGKFATKNSKWI